MMTLRLLVLLLAFLPGAAFADLTATYQAPQVGFTMTVEIASNGDVGRPGQYFITRAGKGYMIGDSPSGPVVMRVEDIGTVMAEQMAKLSPEFREEMAKAPAMVLVQKGTRTINGRTGDAWFLQLQGGRLSPMPMAMISHDPALAALGKAMERQFEMSMSGMSQTMGTSQFKPMLDALETGAPILFAGSELKSVTSDPIAPSRFELPAPPATLDDVRKAMTPAPPRP